MIVLLNTIEIIVICVAVFENLLAQVLPLALVVLEDVLLNVGTVVGRAVPPQADACLGPADHLRRHRLIRLARFRLTGDRVRGSALQRVVNCVNPDVVLGTRPQIGQPAFDGRASEDGTVDAVLALV